jgi:hypothetical protein
MLNKVFPEGLVFPKYPYKQGQRNRIIQTLKRQQYRGQQLTLSDEDILNWAAEITGFLNEASKPTIPLPRLGKQFYRKLKSASERYMQLLVEIDKEAEMYISTYWQKNLPQPPTGESFRRASSTSVRDAIEDLHLANDALLVLLNPLGDKDDSHARANQVLSFAVGQYTRIYELATGNRIAEKGILKNFIIACIEPLKQPFLESAVDALLRKMKRASQGKT